MLHSLISRSRRLSVAIVVGAGLVSCGPIEPVSAERFVYNPDSTYGVLEVIGETASSGGYVMIFCPVSGQHIGAQFAGHCTLSPGGEETPWAVLDSWPIYASGSSRYIVGEFKQRAAAPTFTATSGQSREFGFLIARFGSRAYTDDEIATMMLSPGKVHILGKFDLNRFKDNEFGPVKIENDAQMEAAFRAAFPSIPATAVNRPTITRMPAECGRTDSLTDGTGWNCVLRK